MKTISELEALEKLAFETGLRHDALQTEFNRRAKLVVPSRKNTQTYAQNFVTYLQWLYNQLEECYTDPNRSSSLAPVELPEFKDWAADKLGMSVVEYLRS